jgi:hypothetical protein
LTHTHTLVPRVYSIKGRYMVQADVYITWPNMSIVPPLNNNFTVTRNTKVMLAVVWPDANVGFPDFTLDQTVKWWTDEIRTLHQQVCGAPMATGQCVRV